jgi:hypothetical protein
VAQGSPQIDTTPPSVTQVIASPGSGSELPGNTVTLTLSFGETVTVTGTPTLTLNDGGTATYVSGTGTNALTYTYTVGSGDATVSALAITQTNLPNGAAITDGAGNAANLSAALTTFSNLSIGSDPAPAVTTSTHYMMRNQTASSLFTATDFDNSARFAGTVAGMAGNEALDLAHINFATIGNPTFSGTSMGGVLTVSDGGHTANIALLCNYMASTFAVSSDGHGGTFAVDIPTTSPILGGDPGHH